MDRKRSSLKRPPNHRAETEGCGREDGQKKLLLPLSCETNHCKKKRISNLTAAAAPPPQARQQQEQQQQQKQQQKQQQNNHGSGNGRIRRRNSWGGKDNEKKTRVIVAPSPARTAGGKSGQQRKNNPFDRAVATYAHLLTHNYDSNLEPRRRRCFKLILEALTETLLRNKRRSNSQDLPKQQQQQPITIRLEDLQKVLSRCLQCFGADGDAPTRREILVVLEKTSTITPDACPVIDEIRILFLQFLPLTIGESEDESLITQQFISLFQCLVIRGGNQAMAIAFLKNLVSVPLTESGEVQILTYIHKILAQSDCVESFPDFVACLLPFLATEDHLEQGIQWIRRGWRRLQLQQQQQDYHSKANFLSRTVASLISLEDPEVEGFDEEIQTSYFKCLERTGGQEGDSCLALDLAYLLYVQRHMMDFVEERSFPYPSFRILHCWIATKCFPFDALRWICAGAVVDENPRGDKAWVVFDSIWKDIIESLVDLAVYLVTKVEWETCQPHFSEQTLDFVLTLHNERMNNRQKARLAQIFLDVWRSTLFSTEVALEGLDITAQQKQRLVIVRQVGCLIQRLANERSPIIVEASVFVRVLCSLDDEDPSRSVFESAVRTSCAVISSIGSVCGQPGASTGDVSALVRKLLFCGDRYTLGWTFRGLMLATEIVRSPGVSDSQKNEIKDAVLRIILPPTRRMIEPELGPQCLAFLRAWKDAYPQSDIFQEFQVLLSNTGLIQRISQYKKQKISTKYPTVLGFVKSQEEFFFLPATKAIVGQMDDTRSMVFCVAHFVRCLDPRSKTQCAATVKWVFELVDEYLDIGRKRKSSKWLASSWLEAAIELPTFLLKSRSTTKQGKVPMSWFQQEFGSFELKKENSTVAPDDVEVKKEESATVPDDARSNLVEHFAQENDIIERREIVSYLFGMTQALFVATGVSAAIAKNAFAHYKEMDEGEGQREILLEQICCHLSKVNLIKKKCVSICAVLDCLATAIRRIIAPFSPTSSAKNSPTPKRTILNLQELHMELEQIAELQEVFKTVENEIFSSPAYFGRDMLWDCLNNYAHDDFLRQSFSSDLTSQIPLSNDRVSVVNNILGFKYQLLGQLLPHPMPESQILLRFSQCIKSAIGFVDKFRDGKTVSVLSSGNSIASLSRLAVSYFHLVIPAISCSEHVYRGDGSVNISDLRKMLSNTPGGEEETGTRSDVVFRVLQLIRVLNDVRASTLLLELISHFPGQGEEDLKAVLVETSFQMLHTVYAQSEIERGRDVVPFSVRCINRSLKLSGSSLEVAQRVLKHTLWKSGDAEGSKLGRTLELRRAILLRHFGIIYHSNERRKLFKKHMDEFVLELVWLINDLSGPCDAKDATSSKSAKANSAPKKKSSKNSISVCCLTPSSFPVYFEALLHVAVGGFAVFQPEIWDVNDMFSPYSCLNDSASLFGVIIQIYADHLTLFPRKTATSVFQASKLMLEALSSQISDCVLWRNWQPLLKNAGPDDPGSLSYLKEFFEVVASSICGSLYHLCKCWWKDKKEVSNIAQKRGECLCIAVKKASGQLLAVASAHKLGCPRFNLDTTQLLKPSSEGTKNSQVPKRKRRRLLHTEGPGTRERLQEFPVTAARTGAESFTTPKSVITPIIQGKGEETPGKSSQEDMIDDEDSMFAATGGWGFGGSPAEQDSPEMKIQIRRSL